MPAAHDESLAIGDVYARALLEAANEAGQTDEVAEQFDDLVAHLARDAEFAAFLTSLTVDNDKRRVTLEVLFRTRMNDLLLNTLQVLNSRGRAEIIGAVHECFQLRLEAQRNQVEVDVITAVPLPADMREKLARSVGERIGKTVILKPRVDESLVGGIIVQVGDTRLDASLSRHIRNMRARLLERASTEIFSGKQYVGDTA